MESITNNGKTVQVDFHTDGHVELWSNSNAIRTTIVISFEELEKMYKTAKKVL